MVQRDRPFVYHGCGMYHKDREPAIRFPRHLGGIRRMPAIVSMAWPRLRLDPVVRQRDLSSVQLGRSNLVSARVVRGGMGGVLLIFIEVCAFILRGYN
jgi:hypothetical protein